MKKILAMLLALVMVFALVACGNPGGEQSGEPNPGTSTPADPSTPAEPETPKYEDMGTIMWLSNLSSGAQYDAAVAYLNALCEALGYNELLIVYGDPFNDAAGNLLAVQNAMTDDVVGLIASQDGGIGAIMEEFPELYVCGYNTDMRAIYGEGGVDAACLSNPKFLGSIADGYAHGHQMGVDYANAVIEMGYKKVAVVDFPEFAYPSQAEASASFMATIEEYNKTASEPIQVVGEKTTLMFEPLPDSWFLEEGRSDLDCIVAMCAGQQFVYPTLISAKTNGTCAAGTEMITGGFEADPNLTADVGEGRTVTRLQVSPMEACAYALVLIDNAVTGNLYADQNSACVDSGAYVIDSVADIDNVMTKSLMGTADVSLAHISVDDVVALCGRNNPSYTQAELVALIQSLTPDTLK